MIVDYAPEIAIKRDNKRMLEIAKTPEGVWHAKINFSSLDIINTCLRKAHYQLDRKLKTESEPAAPLFGKGIHKALEHWYSLDASQRQLSAPDAKQAELLAYGHGANITYDGALESIRRFVECAIQLRSLADGDKRSLSNGVRILKAYFAQYANDKLAIVRDGAGSPLIERSFEFRMLETPRLIIDYHGTMDGVFQNTDTGEVFVVDHKTTSSLGKEFIARANPNHQFTGYIWGARQMGVETNKFMVNGIQVAKTKCEFLRVPTERHAEDFYELTNAVMTAVNSYIHGLELKLWPMSAPTACTMWGSCQFLDACSVPKTLRENVIAARWGA